MIKTYTTLAINNITINFLNKEKIPWVKFTAENDGTERESVPSWRKWATGSQGELELSKVLRGEMGTFSFINEKYIIK